MNKQREYFAITYDRKQKHIYVLGGFPGGPAKKLGQCERYSIQNDEWTEISPMAFKKQDASACMLNN